MTTFHPLPEHRQDVRGEVSLLWLGLPGLFFKPGCQCVTTDTKDTLDASHARTLVIGCYDLFLFFFSVSTTWREHTTFTAILAPELLTATGIVTVLDYFGTAAPSTHMNDRFCHHAFTISSLQLDHHRK
jgi:hypothetical protein